MSNNKLLIDKRVMQKFVQITNKHNEEQINQYIRDAQYIDLGNLICEEYLTEIILQPNEFKDLLLGNTYEHNGITYVNAGLEIVLSYFAYARYVKDGSYNDTAFGFVQKTGEKSQNVDLQQRKEIYTFNRQKAVTYWQNVKRFLERTNYKGYNDKCNDTCLYAKKVTQPFNFGVISSR